MKKAHEFLEQRLPWYKGWHEDNFHKKIHWSVFILVAILLTNLSLTTIQSASAQFPVAENVLKVSKKGKEIAQDHILIKFKDNVDKAKGSKILVKHGLSETSEIEKIKVKLVKIPPNNTPEEVIDRLNAQEGDSIEFAEVDSIYYLAYTPNDPQYSSIWQLPRMSAPSAWDSTTGNSEVIIAILDTGTDCTHEDLAAHCVPGWNMYENNSNTSDVNGHGTLTAGTAAAIGDNGLGITSPCYNCKIMPIRVASASGSSSSSLLASAVTYAADHGAKVANLSFGPLSGDSTVSTAAKYFMNHGGVVTVAAGNYSGNHIIPDDPYIIMVSAIDPGDNLYGFSDYGTDIDVAAAGCVTSIINGGGYGGACGTSFSAPTVAGVAGLIFSKNTSLTGFQVRDILISTADDISTPGFDIYTGYGTPNMFAAVTAAGSGPLPDTIPPSSNTLSVVSVASTKISLSWTASSDNSGVVVYDIYRNNSLLGRVTGTSYADSTVSPSSEYSYYIKALDKAGNSSQASNIVTVKTADTDIYISSKQVVNKTATTATLKWTTNINSTGAVSYGNLRLNLSLSATDGVLSTTHTITLNNLTPRTTYYYVINAINSSGSNNTTSQISSFKTNAK